MRREIGTIPKSAIAASARPAPRLRAEARRISPSAAPTGRAMPNTSPVTGSSCVTTTQFSSGETPMRTF